MSTLTAVTQIPLEEEYRKPTGITAEDISKLRQWLRTQPHLPEEHITDLDLVLAYHCSENSAEVAKQVLDLNLTLKTLFTNFFKDRFADDKLLKSAGVVLILPLETCSRDNDSVLYGRLVDYDVRKFVLSEALRLAIMGLDLWQYETGTWPGLVIIIDLEHVTLAHIAKIDLQSVQQFLYYLQEAVLVRLKSLHFMNAPPFMDKLMMILRPFIKKSLMSVLFIHQIGSNTIDKHIPMEALPKEAGGQFKALDQARDDMIARFKANADFFAAENKKRVTESRRPGRPKTISDIFGGIEGSFKKLDID